MKAKNLAKNLVLTVDAVSACSDPYGELGHRDSWEYVDLKDVSDVPNLRMSFYADAGTYRIGDTVKVTLE